MTIAFTGHRDFDLTSNVSQLYKELKKVVKSESVTFLSGMAMGFDLAAAEAVLELRKVSPNIKLKCVIPFRDQAKYFSDDDLRRYNRVVSEADEVVVLEQEYSKLTYMRRNDFLADNSDMIITYFNSIDKGGTAYTIKRARRRKIPICNIYPNPQLSLF